MITLGLLLLLACFAFADGYKEPLPVPANMQHCKTDKDCDYTDTSCSGCCAYEAIAKISQPAYTETHRTYCKDYSAGVCECASSGLPVFTCVQQRCKLSFRP
jgi:hypothetical protein